MYVHGWRSIPSSAATAWARQHTRRDSVAAEEGLTLVEYLGGAERYKVDLSDEQTRTPGDRNGHEPGRQTAAALHTQGIETRNRLRESKTLRNFYFEGLAPARVLLGRVRNRGMQ